MSEISLDQFAREVLEAREQILISRDPLRNRLQGLVSSLSLSSVLEALDAVEKHKGLGMWIRTSSWDDEYKVNNSGGEFETFSYFNLEGIDFSARLQLQPVAQYKLRIATDVAYCLLGKLFKEFGGAEIKGLYEHVRERCREEIQRLNERVHHARW